MTMVSVTEVEGWKRCRRKRELTSLNTNAYTPIWPKMNTLGLGSLVHTAGEGWLKDPTADFGELFYQAGKEFYKELMKVCEAKRYTQTDRQDQEFWEAVTLGRAMCTNYQNYYKTPLPDTYTLVRPEQQCVVPIPGTQHCECSTDQDTYMVCTHNCVWCKDTADCLCVSGTDSSGNVCACVKYHYLEGTLDAIIGDTKDRLFVYERKTFGQHPDIRHLNRTFQFIAYTWILQQAVQYWGTNNEVAGVLYDGMWKRDAPTKTGKWKDSTDALFLRHYILHNQEKIDEFEQELVHTVLEMTNPLTPITHTIPAVKGCVMDCDFMDVCDMMSNGEDTSLILRMNYTKRNLTPAFKEFYALATEATE